MMLGRPERKPETTRVHLGRPVIVSYKAKWRETEASGFPAREKRKSSARRCGGNDVTSVHARGR